MPLHRRRATPAAIALLLLPAFAFASQHTERFWLQNTITHETFGPIVRQTGYRFRIQSDGFVVLDSAPGRIRIASLPAGVPFGPYDIVSNRIIDLGAHAFSILNVQEADVPDLPPELTDLSGLHIQGEPRRTSRQRPELVRRDLPIEEWPLRVGGWIEPSRNIQYDWTVGGFAGGKALALKSTRIGARAEWGNAFLQLGLVTGSEQSGSLTPAMTSLDHLTIDSGSGLNLSGGWLQPFIVDPDWDLLVGGFAEWASESYDLNATALVRTEREPDPSVEGIGETAPAGVSYEYRNVSSGLDLSELILAAVAGIEYHQDAWGGRALLRADILANTSTSGSVNVNGTDLSVSGDRSHPLTVEFSAWGYWTENLRTDLTFQFGAIQAIRLAAFWEF